LILTYTGKLYKFRSKLEDLRQTLLVFRRNWPDKKPQWRNFDKMNAGYMKECERLHIGTGYYVLDLKGNDLSFKQDQNNIRKAISMFGKSVIVTDNTDWTTEEIVKASGKKWKIERAFKDTKSKSYISINPMCHRTDHKIRCHLLAYVIALTIERILELKLKPLLGEVIASNIIKEMGELRSAITWAPGEKKPRLQLEEPTEFYNVVLKTFGYEIYDRWVLQKITKQPSVCQLITKYFSFDLRKLSYTLHFDVFEPTCSCFC